MLPALPREPASTLRAVAPGGGLIQSRARAGGKAPPRAVDGPAGPPRPWEHGRDPAPTDELFRLVPLVTAIRWATTAVSLILLSTGDPDSIDGVIGAAILSYALWRTIRPVDFSGGAAEMAAIFVEGAVMVTAVVASGYWDSPYAFGLVTVIAAAGFTGGIPLAIQVAAGCVVAVAVPYHLVVGDAGSRLTVQWAGELVLVAMLAGYARRLSLQARAETSRYAGRLRQLAEVNDLLLQLRTVAQTLPMSLDLSDTLDSSVARLQELFRPDTVLVLLRDGDEWSVARSPGAHLSRRLAAADLPPVLQRALAATPAVVPASAGDATVALLELDSESGLYGRLTARDELVGLVAVERRTGAFATQDEVMMEEFCQQMAIAVDNARWFSRIGTLAAEQERSRIARDLHDRVGQALALVGFEVDRVAKRAPDAGVREQLIELREHVRSVVGELRDTLYDLRTDVSEEQDLVAALGGFLDRVEARAGLRIDFTHQATHRLPLNVEREVWRIAQEAVFNAERHARAESITIRWTSDGAGAELSVADDGLGMPRSAPDGYGLLGMRERARAIDATLAFSSLPGRGTTVLLTLRK